MTTILRSVMVLLVLTMVSIASADSIPSNGWVIRITPAEREETVFAGREGGNADIDILGPTDYSVYSGGDGWWSRRQELYTTRILAYNAGINRTARRSGSGYRGRMTPMGPAFFTVRAR